MIKGKSSKSQKTRKDKLKVFQSIKAGMEEIKKIESGESKGITMEELFKEIEN